MENKEWNEKTNNKCCQKRHHHTSMNQCKLVNSSHHNCTHPLLWCSVFVLGEVQVPCKKAFQHQLSLSLFVQCFLSHVLLQSLRSCHCHHHQCHECSKGSEKRKEKKANLHIGDEEGSSDLTRTFPGFKSRWMIPCP